MIEDDYVSIWGAISFFVLNNSYASICKLRKCIVKDLPFSESSEKSFYTKLRALLCKPLMQLLSVLLCFIQTKGQ